MYKRQVNVLCLGLGYPIATMGPSVWSNDLAAPEQYPVVVRRLQVIYAGGALLFADVYKRQVFTFQQDNASYPAVELAFYQYDSSSCLVGLNGETRLLVDRDSVLEIVDTVRELLTE